MLDFLPLSIADISNEVVGGLIVVTIGGILSWLFRHRIRRQVVRTFAGGKGGSASVRGTRSGAVGGSGGRGGVGPGGDGGHAEVEGDFSFARGGDGGNAGEHNGRGGRRTLSQGERLNMPTDTWHIGYGGAGANHPEFDRRLGLLAMFRSEYLLAFPQEIPVIEAGVDIVPIRWINKRLEETGEQWRVEEISTEGGYRLPQLPKT